MKIPYDTFWPEELRKLPAFHEDQKFSAAGIFQYHLKLPLKIHCKDKHHK